MEIDFKAKIRVGGYKGNWHFVTLPPNFGKKIKTDEQIPKGGWKSVKIKVRIGFFTWETSMFWSEEHSSYIIPIKRSVIEKLDLNKSLEILFYISIKKNVQKTNSKN